MSSATENAFDLSDRLIAKAHPALIEGDEEHFAAIAASLTKSIADLTDRLDSVRKDTGRMGQELMERDLEVHRLTARLRSLRRFGLDLCLGHVVDAETHESSYIGRLGLLDTEGNQLLVDWRSPSAEPYFGATQSNPMGLARRRRYRWTRGRVSDYWDEVFTADELEGENGVRRLAALDDHSAFIASLGSDRSHWMRDVLGTIQADQDAIIRAGSRGALVVDGGPGTGKTVVALHRAAYLLYADALVGHHRGGVLFIGPHEPYLAYVADVLPSLGEEGVHICTLRDLVPEGGSAALEEGASIARLKASRHLVTAIESAVRFYEQPSTTGMTVETDWADLWLSPQDWVEAFCAPEPGIPHNEAREQVWELLLTILTDKYNGEVSATTIRTSLHENEELRAALEKAWILVEAADLVADLWSVPAYLRTCAPWLSEDDIATLQRPKPKSWTVSDLPLLDAARRRLGDPNLSLRHRRRTATAAAERKRMDRVVDELLQLDDEEGMIAQLRQKGIRDALVDDMVPIDDESLDNGHAALAGPFAHIVVDEAQELTDAEWQMLLSRCPSRSFTIVGDRAQARRGFTESWQERLRRVGFENVEVASLTINYRTPEEIMTEAEPIIRTVLPDANVPTSIRRSGIPVVHGRTSELASIIESWLAQHTEGIVCIISADATGSIELRANSRVRVLTPEMSKGLEFDLVILIDPDAFGTDTEGAVDRYVATTRATQKLFVLTTSR
ncbi:RNA polymerase recycling motor ATPase HelR [Rhodococcus sp. BP22]|uniref:RNA polymerase recycling motor ATPase HelR n=1 Tax=Rhodococcus sp. BP22 TaxID=2758566 RepID=UPI001646D3EF|nr:RNA polymerase recycling motor ATPase HelR [Rhodococcus sp. BP22]